MGSASSLTLDEYKKYATANSVQDFYYTLTAYFNGTENFEAITTETDTSEESSSSSRPSGFPGMMGGGMGGMKFGSTGDFTVTGYSGEKAMTSFINGTSSIIDGGSVFTEGEATYECIISEELAIYNNISVGDKIVISNTKLEEQTFELKVVGFYSDSSANENSMSNFGMFSDPANSIYMSYETLNAILEYSSENATTVTDDNTGRESSSEISGNLSATYSFANVDDYYKFEDEARDLGLDDSYTISSSDLNAYENSLVPLKTLSTMAGTFLIVILIIGAIILIVLNIFNVRERKYEIGVLTAMGMKKHKVALQFLTEIFVVTLIAVLIGACIGAVSSVPITNALLENQISSQSNQANRIEENFGRPGGDMGNPPSDMPGGPGGFGGFDQLFGQGGSAANYISEINSAMNLTVVFQMLGIAILLTIVSGAVSMMFVMRYDPLKILSNRD
ncbi:MAG: ABC transporter permease [Clostridia bacterium]|nr:ABC transporter permease [Clostridia bacterium]